MADNGRDGTCCTEDRCRRKAPILIGHGWLTDKWFAITRYRRLDGEMVEAQEKHDITDQLHTALIQAGWTPPAEADRG
jgi:hypothetical protein